MLQNKKNARVFNGPHVEVALATDTFRVDCRQLLPNRVTSELPAIQEQSGNHGPQAIWPATTSSLPVNRDLQWASLPQMSGSVEGVPRCVRAL